MRAVRLAGFLAFAVAAIAVFLLPQGGEGLDKRIPALLVILVLVVVWHFVTAAKVREFTTTEIITEEFITEIDLPRPPERVVDLTDGRSSAAQSPAGTQAPQSAGPPPNPSGLPATQGKLHGAPLPPGPAILRVPGANESESIQPTEVLPPSADDTPIRATDEQFDIDAPVPESSIASEPETPSAPQVAEQLHSIPEQPGPPASELEAAPAPAAQPAPAPVAPPASAPAPDAWTKWAADLFGPSASGPSASGPADSN